MVNPNKSHYIPTKLLLNPNKSHEIPMKSYNKSHPIPIKFPVME